MNRRTLTTVLDLLGLALLTQWRTCKVELVACKVVLCLVTPAGERG